MTTTSQVLYQSKILDNNDLINEYDEEEFHDLSSLYFCEECDAIRCPRSISYEGMVHYCPNCLFEVPSASVRSQRNRCMRNCTNCPSCLNNLSIIGIGNDDNDNDKNENWKLIELDELMKPDYSKLEPPFVLDCNHCGWNSIDKENGIFDKPTGIGNKIEERKCKEVEEYDNLRDKLENLFNNSLIVNEFQPDVEDVNIKSIYPADTIEDYNEFKIINKLKTLNENDIDSLTSMKNRLEFSNITSIYSNDQIPERTKLQTKYSKRCKKCRQILIKSDNKVNTKHKIKMTANTYIPTISIKSVRSVLSRLNNYQQGELKCGKNYLFEMKVINPLYDVMRIKMKIKKLYGLKRVEMKEEEDIEIGGYNEVMDIEDESYFNKELIKLNKNQDKRVGLIESKGNMIKKGIEIEVDELIGEESKMIIEVTYTYRTITPPTSPNNKMMNNIEEEFKDFNFNILIKFGKIVN